MKEYAILIIESEQKKEKGWGVETSQAELVRTIRKSEDFYK